MFIFYFILFRNHPNLTRLSLDITGKCSWPLKQWQHCHQVLLDYQMQRVYVDYVALKIASVLVLDKRNRNAELKAISIWGWGKSLQLQGRDIFFQILLFLSFVDRNLDSFLLIEAHMYTVSLLIIPSDMSWCFCKHGTKRFLCRFIIFFQGKS